MDAATYRRVSTPTNLLPANSLQRLRGQNLLLDNGPEGGLLATFDAIFSEITRPVAPPPDPKPSGESESSAKRQPAEQPTESNSHETDQSTQKAAEQGETPTVNDKSKPLVVTENDVPMELHEGPTLKKGSSEAPEASLKTESVVPAEKSEITDAIVTETEGNARETEIELAGTIGLAKYSTDQEQQDELPSEDDEDRFEKVAVVAVQSQTADTLSVSEQAKPLATDERRVRRSAEDDTSASAQTPNQSLNRLPSDENQHSREERAHSAPEFDESKPTEASPDTFVSAQKTNSDSGGRNARSERLAEIAREGREEQNGSSSAGRMQELLEQMEPVHATDAQGSSFASDLSAPNGSPQSAEGGFLEMASMVAQKAATATSASQQSSGNPGGGNSVAGVSEGGIAPTSPANGRSIDRSKGAASGESNSTNAGANTTNADRVRLVQRVARAFQKLGDGGGQVHMMLRPAELGSVRLDLKVTGQTLNATLTAQNEAAVEALRDNLGELRGRLEEFGMEIERIEIRKADPTSFNQDGFGRESSGDGRQQNTGHDPNAFGDSSGFREDRDGRSNRHGRTARPSEEIAARPRTASSLPLQGRRSSSGLDLML